MIYQMYDLTGEQQNQINTEILFTVASARSLGVELVRLGFSQSESEEIQERRFRFAANILQRIKKTGKIQFFATKESFDGFSVEAEYLKNKYGDIVAFDKIPEGDFFFVKI